MRNGITHFIFVGPPIGKRGTTCPMFFHLIGYLIPLQNVGEGVDLEAHRIGHFHQHINFRLHIRMACNESLPVQDLRQRLQLQISSWRIHYWCILLFAFAIDVPVPFLFVFTRSYKMVVIHLFHSHSGLWKTDSVVRPPVALLYVLSQGKFYELGHFAVFHLIGSPTPLQFDHGTLTTDRIR